MNVPKWKVPMLMLVALCMIPTEPNRAAESLPAVTQASQVTVPPMRTPEILEGNRGIAAKYPGDIGIEQDPAVIFVESFEDSVDEICSHWESSSGKPIMSKSDEVLPGSGGK